MAHHQQLKFIEIFTKIFCNKTNDKKILEIGSFDVNGAIRSFFPGSKYIGVDLIKGKGVDLVYDGLNLNLEENSYDITISCECFEHNKYWKENFYDMIKFTKNDGFLIFTCASRGRKEHGTFRTDSSSPGSQTKWNYYKNLEYKDFKKLNLNKYFSNYFFSYNRISKDLYFVGIKKGVKNYKLKIDKLKHTLISINSVNIPIQENLFIRILKNIYNLLFNIFSILLPDKIFQN